MIPTWMMDSIQSQMIGGETAKYPVPWQVHVKEEFNTMIFPGIYKKVAGYLCGGTILNKNTVLTAATLVYTEEKKSFFVVPGVTNIDDNVKFQLQAPITVVKHQNISFLYIS